MRWVRFLSMIALGLSLAGFLTAQDTVYSKPSDGPPPDQRVPNVFGTQNNIMQIHASEFTPRDSNVTYGNNGFGYVYPTASDTGTPFWAPVILPSGVLVSYIDLYYYDNDAGNDIDARLQTYTGVGAGPPSTTALVTTTASSGTPGYGYAIGSLLFTPYQVNNNVQYNGGSVLAALIDTGATTSAIAFRGVDIYWARQVSPSPATATFADVPLSSPQNKFVEALVSAGITAGCGGGNYCPNQAVTRGQMAVFLAQSLGLHFPN